MDSSLKRISFRWKAIKLSMFCLLVLTFLILILTFPEGSVPIAVFGSGFGLLFGSWSIVKGDWKWGKSALLLGGLMFASSLIAHTISGGLIQILPSLLLSYVLLMFAVEVLQLLCRQHGAYARNLQGRPTPLSMPTLERTTAHLVQSVSRLGFLFGATYLLTIGTISLTAILASSLPILSDISLYIVVVSTSLTFLLISAEDRIRE